MCKNIFSFILLTVLFETVLTSCVKDDASTFAVTFDSKGGTPTPATQKVKKDGRVEKPADPTLTNHQFTGWTTADDETSSLWDFENGTITTDMTLYAKWEQVRVERDGYSVTVMSDRNGTVAITNVEQSDGLWYVTIAATANDGYCFVKWQLLGGGVTTDNPFTFILLSSEFIVEAIFVQIPTVTVSSDEHGTVSASIVTSTMENDHIMFTVTATASIGYRFVEWQVIEDGVFLPSTTDNPILLSIKSDGMYEVKAIFVPLEDHLTVTVLGDGNGTASVSVVSSTVEGNYMMLTATANSGYRFLEWQVIKGDITLSSTTDNPATFVMPNEAVEVKAIFVQSVGLPENIFVSLDNSKYEHKYDSQNRITQRVKYDFYNGNWSINSSLTLTYNTAGDSVIYRFGSYMSHSTLGGSATFSQNGNKITFTTTYSAGQGTSYSNNSELELNTQGLPVKLMSDCVDFIMGSRYYWSYTASFTWQNGNLTKLDWEKENEQGSSAGTTTYTHDDKKMPFYHCNTPKWVFWCIDYCSSLELYGYNGNNIKTVTSEDGSTTTYEYPYNDDGFPVTLTRTWYDGTTYTETYIYK